MGLGSLGQVKPTPSSHARSFTPIHYAQLVKGNGNKAPQYTHKAMRDRQCRYNQFQLEIGSHWLCKVGTAWL